MDAETVAEAIEDEAADAGAEAGAIAAAIVAPDAAAEAARAAVEPVAEEVRELVERAEEAIEHGEDDERWLRMQAELREAENRIVTRVVSELSPLMSTPTTIVEPVETSPEPDELAETIEDAADELAEAAETDPGPAVTFDPTAEQELEEAVASGRRRVRGVGRRRSG